MLIERHTISGLHRYSCPDCGYETGWSIPISSWICPSCGEEVDEKVQPSKKPPDRCLLCSTAIEDAFVDGKLPGAGWADMCLKCALRRGVRLGVGRGILYMRNSSNVFVRVAPAAPLAAGGSQQVDGRGLR